MGPDTLNVMALLRNRTRANAVGNPLGGAGKGTAVRSARSGWRIVLSLGRAPMLAALLCALAAVGPDAHAAQTIDMRKQPMRFDWMPCDTGCSGGWISAVGVVTADTPQAFEAFARGRDLTGATAVLDSSGGSVNDAIALGRRWRRLGLLTTVGATTTSRTPRGISASIDPDAACESMCVFLLLSGRSRYVPPGARVRVHQIWLGDRADDARAASYSAQDLMIVERDIGRLAKYTFEMGGSGDLLALALNVPPWEDLHELSRDELRLTNLVTTDQVTDVLPHQPKDVEPSVALLREPVRDRLVSSTQTEGRPLTSAKTADAKIAGAKTVDASVPTGAAASPAR